MCVCACVCMCVCMCACVHVCACMCACVCVHVCVCASQGEFGGNGCFKCRWTDICHHVRFTANTGSFCATLYSFHSTPLHSTPLQFTPLFPLTHHRLEQESAGAAEAEGVSHDACGAFKAAGCVCVCVQAKMHKPFTLYPTHRLPSSFPFTPPPPLSLSLDLSLDLCQCFLVCFCPPEHFDVGDEKHRGPTP